MISTSDLVILVVASGALAVGIYRWHENTQEVSAITIPASSNRVVVEPIKTMPEPTLTSLESQNIPVAVQTLPEAEIVTGIVVTTSESSSATQNLGLHQVQSGDYLGKIAKRYNTDVQTLRDLNGISGSLINVGDEILYPL